MAVVTLVQLVAYFSVNRPRRTAVFNINDGEEDGLNGAHTYAYFVLILFMPYNQCLTAQILEPPLV